MASFNNLIKSDLPVLVDFYATWCGPCKTMAPTLQQFAKKYEGRVKVVKVDVDRAPQVMQTYRIQGVPTLMLFQNGQIRWQQSGAMPLAQLEKAVEKALH